jgi:hypothetical protein
MIPIFMKNALLYTAIALGSVGTIAAAAMMGISNRPTESAESPSVPAAPRVIEVTMPVDSVVYLCGGRRAAEVLAAHRAIIAQTERPEVIAKETFSAALNLPQTCNQYQTATPSTPVRFTVGAGYYVTVGGSVPDAYVRVEEHQ